MAVLYINSSTPEYIWYRQEHEAQGRRRSVDFRKHKRKKGDVEVVG